MMIVILDFIGIFVFISLVTKKIKIVYVYFRLRYHSWISKILVSTENIALFTVLKCYLKMWTHFRLYFAGSRQLVEFWLYSRSNDRNNHKYAVLWILKFEWVLRFAFKILCISGWFLSNHFLCHQVGSVQNVNSFLLEMKYYWGKNVALQILQALNIRFVSILKRVLMLNFLQRTTVRINTYHMLLWAHRSCR